MDFHWKTRKTIGKTNKKNNIPLERKKQSSDHSQHVYAQEDTSISYMYICIYISSVAIWVHSINSNPILCLCLCLCLSLSLCLSVSLSLTLFTQAHMSNPIKQTQTQSKLLRHLQISSNCRQLQTQLLFGVLPATQSNCASCTTWH